MICGNFFKIRQVFEKVLHAKQTGLKKINTIPV